MKNGNVIKKEEEVFQLQMAKHSQNGQNEINFKERGLVGGGENQAAKETTLADNDKSEEDENQREGKKIDSIRRLKSQQLKDEQQSLKDHYEGIIKKMNLRHKQEITSMRSEIQHVKQTSSTDIPKAFSYFPEKRSGTKKSEALADKVYIENELENASHTAVSQKENVIIESRDSPSSSSLGSEISEKVTDKTKSKQSMKSFSERVTAAATKMKDIEAKHNNLRRKTLTSNSSLAAPYTVHPSASVSKI